MLLHILPFVYLALGAVGDFGFTHTKGGFVIDAGSTPEFHFTVDDTHCNINSIKFDGVELQSKTRGSHINAGLGNDVVVTAVQKDDHIVVTCASPTLTHYHVVKNGVSDIFMATLLTEANLAELRFIARLDPKVLPNLWPHGDVSNTADYASVVEGSDVFVVGNETRSKFYSSDRFIEDKWHCVAGSGIRVCFIMPGAEAYETSSGGPFHRDINTNNVGTATHLTFYMQSNHVQTETYRTGLFGPYVLSFRKSNDFPTEQDTQIDTSFFENLDISGYVPQASRGRVEGKAAGVDASLPAVVHWFNNQSQYWTTADASGHYTSPFMKKGVYTQVLYQDELKVNSIESVQVSEGKTTAQDINSAWPQQDEKSVFRIGVWDGKPTGFRNADKQLRMHPSDYRMDTWQAMTFRVGEDDESLFPMALFKSVNSPVTIEFNLGEEDLQDSTLWIGTTLAFQSGRPSVSINGHKQQIPPAPTKIDSRGVTRGAYRGYGEIYKFDIPTEILQKGKNIIVMDAASGSTASDFLNPNFIFDAIQLWRK